MSKNATRLQLEDVENVQTPSEKIIENSNNSIVDSVTDADGRVFKIRLPTPLDEMDFSAALGKENAMNQVVFVMAMPLMFIESIDGKPFRLPANYAEIRAAIKMLGRAGTNALQKVVLQYQSALSLSAEDLDQVKK